jgi:hypothetical protein
MLRLKSNFFRFRQGSKKLSVEKAQQLTAALSQLVALFNNTLLVVRHWINGDGTLLGLVAAPSGPRQHSNLLYFAILARFWLRPDPDYLFVFPNYAIF